MILRVAMHSKHHRLWPSPKLLRNRLLTDRGLYLLARARLVRFRSLSLEQRLGSHPALNVLLPDTMRSGLVSID
jgi:hypothetical protein